MRRYAFLALMLLLSFTPIKAEFQISSFSSTVSSLQKELTLKSYNSPLEIRRGLGRSRSRNRSSGGGAIVELINNLTSGIENPKEKKIVEYLIYGFLFLIAIFFNKDND